MRSKFSWKLASSHLLALPVTFGKTLIWVFPSHAFLQVTAYGPGLEKHGVVMNKWADFTVDTRAAGLAPLKVYCEDVEGMRLYSVSFQYILFWLPSTYVAQASYLFGYGQYVTITDMQYLVVGIDKVKLRSCFARKCQEFAVSKADNTPHRLTCQCTQCVGRSNTLFEMKRDLFPAIHVIRMAHNNM